MPEWLALLPLTRDDGEAHENHMLLCSLVENKSAALLGDGAVNLPRVVTVLCLLLGGDASLKDLEIEKELQQRMVVLLCAARPRHSPASTGPATGGIAVVRLFA